MTTVTPTAARTDPRITAYCTRSGPEVFTGIVHGNQIWTPDPFDVETIHAEARETYARLLNRASSAELPTDGKTLLLLGEAGSGKTHLMRAFRTTTHAAGLGYCGYLQMVTRSDNYARYLLSNLIDSLEHPHKPGFSETGLSRLARGLLDTLEMIPIEERQRLCDDLLEPQEVAREVHRFAYLAIQHPRFRDIESDAIDVMRAILFTLANDARVHAIALNWLRCQDLNRYDRELLGDLVPRPQPEMPLKTILALGRVMAAVHSAALVLLVDQIEQVIDMDRTATEQGEQFRAAVNTLVDVADGLPNAVVVVGCLEDLFKIGRQYLPRPKLDRLEHNPESIRLSGVRSIAEIESIVARRLDVLFDAAGVASDVSSPVAPFTATDFIPLSAMRGRDILDNLRQHREQCCRAGEWVRPAWGEPPPPPPPSSNWEQRWNDYLAAYSSPVLVDEPKLAELLAFTIRTVSAELPDGVYFGAQPEDRFVPVDVHTGGNAVEKLYVAICDRNARGGGLGKQVEEVARKAGEIPAVLVRSTSFPNTPTAAVSRQIASLIAPRGKGRKYVVENSDWRAMAAFRQFHGEFAREAGYADWQHSDRPLAELRSVSVILDLQKLLTTPARSVSPPPVVPVVQVEAAVAEAVRTPKTPARSSICLGETRGSTRQTVELQPRDLCRHAAFLGGSGSGKTTAALAIIEQLLLAGVSAVLLDRKGDLSRYADPRAWTLAEPDPDRAAQRDRLRGRIDIALYTPGAETGRPLAIPVVPGDLGSLPHAEREQLAQYAAASLGTMMGYRSRGPDPKLVILQKAIEVLAQSPGDLVTAKSLQQLIADQDDALIAQVEGFEAKHFKKLSQDLLTLSLQHRRLLEADETLDVDDLLGRTRPDKTRLSIINTQFLGDATTTDFWVSQLLLSVDRWRAKHPAPDGQLQAVFLFDEADQYLPAVKQPAAKGPMESLLKRARSAGIGLFLATQSPGDFDYRCRDQVMTWLIGRVREQTAIDKLKPMLERRPDAADKLAGQSAGQFYLVRESDVQPVSVARNLIPTEQLPEDRILALAADRKPAARS